MALGNLQEDEAPKRENWGFFSFGTKEMLAMWNLVRKKARKKLKAQHGLGL